MSLREVKALTENSFELKVSKTRSGRAIGIAMSEEGSLERQIEQLQADLVIAKEELKKKEEQLEEMKVNMEQTALSALEAGNKANEYFEEMKYLQQQLEDERIHAELSMLRTVNELHLEHQRSLQAEKERLDRERFKMEKWIADMEESFHQERESLLKKVASLEERNSREVTDVIPATLAEGNVLTSTHARMEGTTLEDATLAEGNVLTSTHARMEGTTLEDGQLSCEPVSQCTTVGAQGGVGISETTPIISEAS